MRRSQLTSAAMGLVFLLTAPGVHAVESGWTLTISASDADPYVQEAQPSGGFRHLYLWAACASGGPSALQAVVVTSLPVPGFTPMGGVLNAGTPTSLLLAIPGCPDPSPLVLGMWVVVDDEGTLCLDADGPLPLLAVDCSINPSASNHLQVFGYASASQVPCPPGEDFCDTAGETPVPLRAMSWARLRSPYRRGERGS